MVFARRDVDLKTFSKKMNHNIDWVLEDNPEVYETKPIHRGPASVTPVENEEKNRDKLDEIEEQANTHTKW